MQPDIDHLAKLPDIAERMTKLREAAHSGPVSLEQAAALLGTSTPDLMSALVIHELRKMPGAAALIACAEGAAVVKAARDGEISITVPDVLAQVLIVGLLHDPSAQASICAPLAANTSKGVN